MTGPYIVFLGRMEIDLNGLDLLVDSLIGITSRSDVRVVLAGDGRDEANVGSLLKDHGLRDRVLMIGRVDGPAKWRLLAGAEVALMPSRYETFGITALEAMACGTPVVAFGIGCLREIVTPRTGRIVPAFDTDAFAGATLELLRNTAQRKRLGDTGRAMARGYDWHELALAQETAFAKAGDA